MRIPRDGGGFTIAELLITTMIASMIFATLAAFYSTGVRYQVSGLHRMVIQNRALVALRAVQSQVAQATVLTSPAAGVPSSVLEGGINVRPGDLGEMVNLTGGEDRRYFHFCVGNTSTATCPPDSGHQPRCLWLYTGPWPAPPITCGLSSGGQLLASPLTTAQPFSLPFPNLLRVSFEVVRPADAAVPEARAAIQTDIRFRAGIQ